MTRKPRNAETMKAVRAMIAANLAKLDNGDGFMAAATMLCCVTPDGGPDALFGSLLHSFARLLRQVVYVVPRHQHLDAVDKLL